MTARPSYDSSVIGSEKYGLSYSIDEARPPPPPRKQEDDFTALPASIPYSDIPAATASTQPLRPTRRPLLARLRAEYTLLTKKKRIAILVGIAALIIFIIGLAAGLSTRSHSSTTNLPLPNNHGGPYTGDLTYYDPGLGACGITSTSKENIVAVSHIIFDAVSTSSNPNANPLCGKKIRARKDGKSIDVTVVDRCVGCKTSDLDVTESVFSQLADIGQGRVLVQWAWLDNVPGADIPSASSSATPAPTSSVQSNSTLSMSSTATTTMLVTSSATVLPTTATITPTTTTIVPPVSTTTTTPLLTSTTSNVADTTSIAPAGTGTDVSTSSVPTTTAIEAGQQSTTTSPTAVATTPI